MRKWKHAGCRIEMFEPTVGAKLSLTEVSAEDVPMTLTQTGADALGGTFGISPVAAGIPFFEGSAGFDVLTGPLTGTR